MHQKIMANTPEFHLFDLQKVEESQHMIFGADYILIQPNSDGCTLHLANKQYKLKKTDAVLLAPFNPFRLSIESSAKNKINNQYNILHFRLHALGQTFVDSVQFRLVREMLEEAKWGSLFTGEVVNEVRQKLNQMENKFDFIHVIYFLELLNTLAKEDNKERLLEEHLEINSAKKAEDRLQIALDYIDGNLSESLSVDQVSKQVHMAESTFSRFFHSNKGVTFKQYLIEQRVRQAARYLVSTDWSIATISAEVGFSSLSNFNSKFKNLLRVTPKKYRSDHTDMRAEITDSISIAGQVQRQCNDKENFHTHASLF